MAHTNTDDVTYARKWYDYCYGARHYSDWAPSTLFIWDECRAELMRMMEWDRDSAVKKLEIWTRWYRKAILYIFTENSWKKERKRRGRGGGGVKEKKMFNICENTTNRPVSFPTTSAPICFQYSVRSQQNQSQFFPFSFDFNIRAYRVCDKYHVLNAYQLNDSWFDGGFFPLLWNIRIMREIW